MSRDSGLARVLGLFLKSFPEKGARSELYSADEITEQKPKFARGKILFILLVLERFTKWIET